MRYCKVIGAVAILLAVLITMPIAALAASPVGKWSGSASGAGRKASASATFRDDGTCSLTALGVTASGTWGGGSLSVSAMGMSATLSYSCSGNSMTISGKYMGQKGSMSLSRKGGSSGSSDADSSDSGSSSETSGASGDSSKTKNASLYSEWKLTGIGRAQTLRLYEDGWLYWREDHYPPKPSEDGEDAQPLEEFAAGMSESDGKLTLMRIEGIAMPEAWQTIWGDSNDTCDMPYAISGDKLMLLEGDGTMTFIKDATVTLDKKPSEAALLPRITLKRGDTGKAVRMLQQWLIDEGYLEGDADGQFGPKTEAAVRTYQAHKGNEENGTAAEEILTKLSITI